MNTMALGWQLMGFGLAGVFTTLILLLGTIVLLTKIFPYKDETADPDDK